MCVIIRVRRAHRVEPETHGHYTGNGIERHRNVLLSYRITHLLVTVPMYRAADQLPDAVESEKHVLASSGRKKYHNMCTSLLSSNDIRYFIINSIRLSTGETNKYDNRPPFYRPLGRYPIRWVQKRPRRGCVQQFSGGAKRRMNTARIIHLRDVFVNKSKIITFQQIKIKPISTLEWMF